MAVDEIILDFIEDLFIEAVSDTMKNEEKEEKRENKQSKGRKRKKISELTIS